MLHHIVWWTFKEEANGATAHENMEKMKAMLLGLEGKIASLKSIQASTEILPTATMPVQLILQTTHADAAGLKDYAENPLHVACGGFIKSVVASRQAIDYIV